MQRRLVAWRAGGESINSLILQGGELQRARARQLVRTNPYAANAAASFTTHAVGCGINLSSLVEASALKDEIQRLWLAWTHEADAYDLTDVYDTSSRPPTRSACRATPSRRWTSSRALGHAARAVEPIAEAALGRPEPLRFESPRDLVNQVCEEKLQTGFGTISARAQQGIVSGNKPRRVGGTGQPSILSEAGSAVQHPCGQGAVAGYRQKCKMTHPGVRLCAFGAMGVACQSPWKSSPLDGRSVLVPDRRYRRRSEDDEVA
jgi:Phage portal protein, lambda family